MGETFNRQDNNMNLLKKIVLPLLLLLGLMTNTKGQFRTYSNEFLNIGAGARGLGMGGAQVASVNDATAGYWNPAGVANIDKTSFSAMHADYFSGIGKYDFIAGATPLANGNRSIGVTLLRFAVDDIPNTLYLVNPDGSINYNNIQTFSSADYAMLFSFGQQLSDDPDYKVSVGANAKMIYRKVGSFANAWGAGLDAGFMIQTPDWSFGITARDLTSTYNAWRFHFTDAEKEKLYLTNNAIPIKSTESTAPSLVVGGAYNFYFNDKFSLMTEGALNVTFDGKRNTVISSNPVSVDPHLGVEANISNNVFIRAGVNNFQKALADGDIQNQKKTWIFQPSLGAGFRIGNATIDYAFTNLANQSNPLYTHVFSLKLALGDRDN